MKHTLTIVLAASLTALSGIVLAQNHSQANAAANEKMVKIGDRLVPASKIKESLHRANLARTGGRVRKANTARGWFVVLNASDFDENEVNTALEVIAKRARIQSRISKLDSVECGKVKEHVASAGGKLGVLLISDAKSPSLVVAPEDGWAIINVEALKNGAKDAATHASRVRREILRAFAFIAGGAYTAKGDFVMRDVKSPSDLDGLKQEDFGIELIRKFDEGISFYGVKPWYETTYLKACEEGWAPAPTNDVQKAIWDSVHALPTAPLKIKPETKKVKE